MKKTLIALLLISLVLANHCASCTCGASGCQGNDCNCNACSNCDSCCQNDPSFPVNCPVCIDVPQQVTPPPCAIPNIPEACVCPPPVDKPHISPPQIEICDLTPPPVVEPPTIKPPTVIIPPPPKPHICPPTPPPVPPPTPCNQPTLPLPPIIVLPPSPIPTPTDPTLTNKFRLTFQYACREGVSLKSCLGNIIWNNKIIFSIVPTNHYIQTKSIWVYIVKGENRLQIEGAGTSDSLGLIIDNVRLIRDGTVQNICVNGNFEQPNVGNGWNIFNNIPGWAGVGIEIGDGQIYNPGWNSQVCELDGNNNYIITQHWHFDSDNKLTNGYHADTNSFSGQTLVYKLEFDYAARIIGFNNLFSSQCVVVWNDVVIGTIIPHNGYVQHKVILVKLKAGKNVLQFDASSLSDSFGLTIDNVKLYSVYDSTNLIVNGKFEVPELGGANQWTEVNGGIYGWEAVRAEVGHGKTVYNNYYSYSNDQVIELDSNANQRYTQVINIPQCKYSALLIKMKTSIGDAAVQDKLYEAQCAANYKVSGAVSKIKDNIYKQIYIKNEFFNKYLCKLYKIVKSEVEDLKEDEWLALNQYDCISEAYIGKFGKSYETDFDSGYFNSTNTQSWSGYIAEINGKVIKCFDKYGICHYIQIAPCTHFEGKFPLPVIGHKIYWTGAPCSNGKTYVKYATTCNNC